MPRYEFKVIPAPRRGEKAPGARTTEERFAVALTTLMNAMGAEGWDYLRADTLPVDERSGLTGTKTSFQNMLVFRRELAEEESPSLTPRAEAVFVAARRLGPAETDAAHNAPPVGPAKDGGKDGAKDGGVAAE